MNPPSTATQSKAEYVPPRIVVMSEEDMLKTFQVTSAQGGWWTVGCSSCGG